jgi:hypothetical protein
LASSKPVALVAGTFTSPVDVYTIWTGVGLVLLVTFKNHWPLAGLLTKLGFAVEKYSVIQREASAAVTCISEQSRGAKGPNCGWHIVIELTGGVEGDREPLFPGHDVIDKSVFRGIGGKSGSLGTERNC